MTCRQYVSQTLVWPGIVLGPVARVGLSTSCPYSGGSCPGKEVTELKVGLVVLPALTLTMRAMFRRSTWTYVKNRLPQVSQLADGSLKATGIPSGLLAY